MSERWRVLVSPPLHPHQIMALDAALLDQLKTYPVPTLHLYDWSLPSFTHGYFSKPEHHVHLSAAQSMGIAWARRPTGGGITFHLADFAFSLFFPNSFCLVSSTPVENYRFVNRWVAKTLRAFGLPIAMATSGRGEPFCMSASSQYDLVVAEKKICGAAQRKTSSGILHQGSLSLFVPPFPHLEALVIDPKQLQQMQHHTCSLFDTEPTTPYARSQKQSVRELFQEHFVASAFLEL